MNRIVTSNIRQDAGGATMLEFSIALSAFVFLFLLLVDFARYVEAKGVLNTGALDGISLATTIPGLEIVNRDDLAYKKAYKSVQLRARAYPLETLFSDQSSAITLDSIITTDLNNPPPDWRCPNNGDTVCLIVPAPGEFLKEPIKIIMKGTFDPMFPGAPNLPITVTATAFREPATTSSMPLLTDCNGNRYGSEQYFADCGSSCTGIGMVWFPNYRECRCRKIAGFYDDGNGGCECNPTANFQKDPNDPTKCICLETQSCTFPQTFDSSSCKCTCGKAITNACKNSGGKLLGSCVCECNKPGQIPNAAGDGCECDANGWRPAEDGKSCIEVSDGSEG